VIVSMDEARALVDFVAGPSACRACSLIGYEAPESGIPAASEEVAMRVGVGIALLILIIVIVIAFIS
jgi:hypothetical protein